GNLFTNRLTPCGQFSFLLITIECCWLTIRKGLAVDESHDFEPHGAEPDPARFRRETTMTHHWHFSDHLKSVWKLMKDLGFNNDTSEPIEFRFELPSRVRPVDPNMEYKRTRHFDPTVGRWMSRDPLGFDAGDDHLFPYAP